MPRTFETKAQRMLCARFPFVTQNLKLNPTRFPHKKTGKNWWPIGWSSRSDAIIGSEAAQAFCVNAIITPSTARDLLANQSTAQLEAPAQTHQAEITASTSFG
jgi:hypothetical protein